VAAREAVLDGEEDSGGGIACGCGGKVTLLVFAFVTLLLRGERGYSAV